MSAPVPARIRHARRTDAGELFTLQRASFLAEAQRYGDPMLPPLRDTLQDVCDVLGRQDSTVLIAATTEDGEHGRRGRIVGSARLRVGADSSGVGQVGRIIVAPDLQGRGLGTALLEAVHAEAARVGGLHELELFTGSASQDNLALYRRHGYCDARAVPDEQGVPVQVLRRTL